MNNITIDANNVNFCCGPCSSIEPEPEPTNHLDGPWYALKPHIRRNGKAYFKFVWPLPKNGCLIVKNLRICDFCCSRYNDHEFSEEEQIRDANTIIKKLKQYVD